MYNTYSQERIDFIRAQSRERIETQREQESEEAREMRREGARRRMALFRQNEM